MTTELQRLRVANICYANVSSSFAMLCDASMRGPNFDWAKFPEMMERESGLWQMVYLVKCEGAKAREEIAALAQEYAKEIADTLLHRSGFLKPQTSSTPAE